MKSFILGVLILLALSGCTSILSPSQPVLHVQIKLASPRAVIHRPLIGSGDDWYATPLQRTLLLFNPGRDQYGNPVGLSEEGWGIESVVIQCALKSAPDTIFNPPYQPDRFWADGINNACVWYPTFTAPIETIIKLPYPPSPERGYPFDPCLDITAGYIPEQTATITATARAESIEVIIQAEDMGGGTYMLDLPGATPQSTPLFYVTLTSPRDITITWIKGDKTSTSTVSIPAEWFYASGSWEIPVGPVGCSD